MRPLRLSGAPAPGLTTHAPISAQFMADMPAASLDARIDDSRRQFEAIYAQFLRTGNPHDRDAAILWQTVFLDACRERRARVALLAAGEVQ